MILTADLHLTDSMNDEYRWQVFEKIAAARAVSKQPQKLYILGDMFDRKDRHSSALLNRTVDTLIHLMNDGFDITILSGNHDKHAHAEKSYWDFLGELRGKGITYITRPVLCSDLLLMPFQVDPIATLQKFDMKALEAVFMHQPVTGAVGEHGMKLKIDRSPIFPRHLKVYSGDIHTPQKVGRVEYVGAPHPVNFGDGYKCRLLRLDKEYGITEEIILHPPSKHLFRVHSMAELAAARTRPGDQARVEFHVAADKLEQWAVDREAIGAWATERKVRVASIETIIDAHTSKGVPQAAVFDADPTDTLAAFATSEGLEETLVTVGMDLLASELES